MQNTAQTIKTNETMKFDIKGSKMSRFVKLDDERFWLNRMHQDKVMKDLNYL